MRTVYSIKLYSVKPPRYPASQATLKGTRLLSLGLKPQGFTARIDKVYTGKMLEVDDTRGDEQRRTGSSGEGKNKRPAESFTLNLLVLSTGLSSDSVTGNVMKRR